MAAGISKVTWLKLKRGSSIHLLVGGAGDPAPWDLPPPRSHLHPLPSGTTPTPHTEQEQSREGLRPAQDPHREEGPKALRSQDWWGWRRGRVEGHCKPPTHPGVGKASNQGVDASPGASSGALQPHCATRHWSVPRGLSEEAHMEASQKPVTWTNWHSHLGGGRGGPKSPSHHRLAVASTSTEPWQGDLGSGCNSCSGRKTVPPGWAWPTSPPSRN